MLPLKALEGAFVEGGTILQISLLLMLIVEDIDLGRERKMGDRRETRWGGSQFTHTHPSSAFFRISRNFEVKNVKQRGRIDDVSVDVAHEQLKSMASTSGLIFIDLEHQLLSDLQAEGRGLTRKHCHRQACVLIPNPCGMSSPSCSSSSPTQWVSISWIGVVTGSIEGVDAGSKRLLCFRNYGLKHGLAPTLNNNLSSKALDKNNTLCLFLSEFVCFIS